jgi:tRNA threonylcarbamoyladenosine biosynthesis protein TsaB
LTVLGIETATAVCGAAIVRNGLILREEQLDRKHIHSEKLLTLIDVVLTYALTGVSELDGIAVSIGPGSFTGLRIGLSAAKGLVYAAGTPLVAVSTLQALSQRAVDAGVARPGECILSTVDARRDEVYARLSVVTGKKAEPVWEDRATTVGELVRELGDRRVILTGEGTGKLLAAPESVDRKHRYVVPADEFLRASSGTVALLGEQLLRTGNAVDPSTLEPRYIKEFTIPER